MIRMTMGSVAHQERRCSCHGGHGCDEEDGLTRRDSEAREEL
jgi:hypothetical protein